MHSNPLLSSKKNLLLYILFWFIITALYINLLRFGNEIDFRISIIDSLVFNIILALLGLSFWYSSKYLSFEQNKITRFILSHIFGGIILTAIWLLIGYYLVINIAEQKEVYKPFFMSTLQWRFTIGLLMYFLLTAFYYVVIYYTGFQETMIKQSQLRTLVTEAELKSLKFQINPHFIFNSLNSISALTEIDPARARMMTIKLADFLRYTLANNTTQKNRLFDELENVKRYLEIEKIRFEDRFEFVEETTPGCLDIPVPNMILQPLFENAIKHAVYEAINKIIITFSCKKENDFVLLKIGNNLEGVSRRKGAGVGLKNIESRLELIYQRKNLIEVQNSDDYFTVKLYIPVEQ